MSRARMLERAAQPVRVARTVIAVDVESCPRCSKEHRQLEMRYLRQPSGSFVVEDEVVRLVGWSTCPRTGEPVMHASEVSP